MNDFKHRRPQINITTELPTQNAYTLALNGEYAHVAFDEVRAPKKKGLWRSEVFSVDEQTPMDVEIGTGTGIHFANRTNKHPERCLVGLELKYKPLIQSIRRALRGGAKNAAICRFHAFNIDQLFGENEINHVFIHFPDPWTSPKKPKNRVVNHVILGWLHEMQRPGSFIEFKTDSRDYFLWALEEIRLSPYRLEFMSENFYAEDSIYLRENTQTTFESLFVKQGLPIHYARLVSTKT